jgi:hypothetical protein
MTQAFNLSQLANNLNTAGQLDATDGLVNAVPIANGGTGASTNSDARANLNVPSRTGGDASGTWGINISGNAATATSAANGGVTSVNGLTGAVVIPVGTSQQLFVASGTFTVPAGVTSVMATVIAGGGGGKGGVNGPGGAVVNGGSNAAQCLVTGLTPGQNIAVTVGAGGAGSAGSNSSTSSNGTTGGASSFGSFVVVSGGPGGGTGTTPTITTSSPFLKEFVNVIGFSGGQGPSTIDSAEGIYYWGGGSGGAGWSSGGGGGAAIFANPGGGGGSAFNGTAGSAGGNSSSTVSGAGGAGGSNSGGAAGGSGGANSNAGGGGGGGGAGAVLLRW